MTAKQQPFYLGGIASAASACVTHPLDLLKVRLQTYPGQRPSLFRVVLDINSKEGFLAFYNGLSASLLRQLSYSTIRFGVYQRLKEILEAKKQSTYISLPEKIAISSLAGVFGGLVGTPADVVNVRMQASVKGAEGAPVYKHALDGLYRVAKDDGVLSLWRGVAPNLLRAVLMTSSQLASYDQAKEFLLSIESLQDILKDDLKTYYGRSILTHTCSSMIAGLIATTVCSPVDVIKTRLMNGAVGEYRNAFHCAQLILTQEGVFAFFKGFLPSWSRLGPHTVITFLVLEQLRALIK